MGNNWNFRGAKEREITFEGKTMTIADWSRIRGVTVSAIRSRLDRGLPLEKVFHVGRLPYVKKENK